MGEDRAKRGSKGTERDMPQDMEHAYVAFRRLLLSALARLALQGYPTRPSDGMEIIHDFFIEAWPGIEERYDDSRGSFTTYLFASFIRFARPRIVRSLQWERNLLPPDELSRIGESETDSQQFRLSDSDIRAVRDALETLPPEHRDILIERVALNRSERDLAKLRGISRYRLRMYCAEALGRLALVLNEQGPIKSREWEVIRRLWAEGRTIEDVAESLNLTGSEVRSVRKSVVRQLASNIARVERRGDANMSTDYCLLWRRLVDEPENTEALEAARASMPDLLDHIEECDKCAHFDEKDSKRLASLYRVLAGTEEEQTLDAKLLDRLLEARSDDDRNVEEAVLTALLPSLPKHLSGVIPWLAWMLGEKQGEMTDDSIRSKATWGPIVRDGGLAAFEKAVSEISQEQIEKGILNSPSVRRCARTLFQGMNAVGMVVESALRRSKSAVLYMQPAGDLLYREEGLASKDFKPDVGRNVLIGEIVEVASVSPPVANELTGWIHQAARSHAALLPALTSSPYGQAVAFKLMGSKQLGSENLFLRWRPSPQVAQA